MSDGACEACEGSGSRWLPNDEDEVGEKVWARSACPECNGSGEVRETNPPDLQRSLNPCPESVPARCNVVLTWDRDCFVRCGRLEDDDVHDPVGPTSWPFKHPFDPRPIPPHDVDAWRYDEGQQP